MNIRSSIIKLVKSARDKERNQTIWKMFFVLEQLLIGGKNRKIVIAVIAKKVRNYRPSPYHPKGIINSVEQWFDDSIPPQMRGSWIKDIIPEQSVELKKPNSVTAKIHPAFSGCGKSDLSPKAYLCFLKNARVVNVNGNGAIISYDNKVFADFTSELDKSIEKHKVFKSYINKPQFRKECLATIFFTDNIGYYHWIFENLPRLKLLEGVIDEIDYLIVPYNLKRFHLETLNLLGFPEEKLLKIKDGDHLLCENLFVPSLLTISKWSCEFLRESLIPDDVAEPHRLIYISRKDAPHRKIINEEEVENYLREIGFEIVQMSELTFLEQVRICAEAKIVVGPHGAGLTNTVFCRNGKILEIFSPSYVNMHYWILSNQIGNEYCYLLGEDVPGNTCPWWDFEIDIGDFKVHIIKRSFSNFADFRIDMEACRETLEWMLKDSLE